eukprot:345348-Prorocentrum_minimum.AAC.1
MIPINRIERPRLHGEGAVDHGLVVEHDGDDVGPGGGEPQVRGVPAVGLEVHQLQRLAQPGGRVEPRHQRLRAQHAAPGKLVVCRQHLPNSESPHDTPHR